METKRRHAVGFIISMLATCVVLAMTLLAAGPTAMAAAEQLEKAPAGTHRPYTHNGSDLDIGVTAKDSEGRYYYCREINKFTDYWAGTATKMTDDATARAVGWMIEQYKDSTDFYVHTAIAVIVHDEYDIDPDIWDQVRVTVMSEFPEAAAKVEELWSEAKRNTPAKAVVEHSYADGQRSGTVTVRILNMNNEPLAGVPYTVTLGGSAQFDDGGTTLSGSSVVGKDELAWTATGDGDVSVDVQYTVESLDSIESQQTLVRSGGKIQASKAGGTFEVTKTFKPTISTQVAEQTVNRGETIQDVVTSGIADEGEGEWPEGVALTATGWYFDRIAPEGLTGPVAAQAGETAQAFIARLASLGYTPSAYGSVQFDGPNQSRTADAVNESGNLYYSVGDAQFGTWVWAFEVDEQSSEAAEYLAEDYVSAFLDVNEVNSNREIVSVESDASEFSALVGSELRDTITVSGFPDDHGEYPGNQLYGFEADNQYAQVTVWWAGDKGNPQNNGQYYPAHAEEPQEDEHHEIIGTWDYPAKNGEYRIGGEEPDAHGNPVNIIADVPGWYVFVWKFTGDSRVAPTSSAYNDGWERVFVTEVEDNPETPAKTPMIVTEVSDQSVLVGEEFHDTAMVIGEVPEGSYVTFSAYEPVAESAEPGSGEKLLDEERVTLDSTLAAQRVVSSNIVASQAGYVYWQASVWDAEGNMLATHELGEKLETVLVEEPQEPQDPSVDPPDEPEPTSEIPDDPVDPLEEPEIPEEPEEPEARPEIPEEISPEEPEAVNEPILAYTGSDISLMVAIGVTALLIAALAVYAIRRQSDS